MSEKSNPATCSQAAGSNSSETSVFSSATARHTRGRFGWGAGSAAGADRGRQRLPGGVQPFLLQALTLLLGLGEEGVEVDGLQLRYVGGHRLPGRPETDLALDADAQRLDGEQGAHLLGTESARGELDPAHLLHDPGAGLLH